MYRIIGVGFDHMHIGDQLAVAASHPDAELVGVYDGSGVRAGSVLEDLSLDIPVFDDLDDLLTAADADIAFVCSTTAEHPTTVARLARAGIHMIVEKPMADSNDAADAMVEAATAAGVVMAVNWPLAWVPSHRTAQRLAASGAIGRIEQVHFYDGNRGPLFHGHGKVALEPTTQDKAGSWWYDPARGGGSMRDYLGYGTTLGTWFRGGEVPHAVTAAWHVPHGLRVDEQSVVIGHYADGLSVFETRWGTHTDPWTLQPQPRCGFVLTGSAGSIASWDYDDAVTVHRSGEVERVPNDAVPREDATSLANLIAHLQSGRPLDAPLTMSMSRAGHAIVEAAIESAGTGRRVDLP